ncbi:hypothetical protein AB0G02_37870 [Actinosynnema sp. NPDC023658]|uniref:hypothetical protein n=1 Tax=Actinosynnema sp. NPDC023658 TaxID=3155465 RepID=UPI0033DCAC85
MLEGERIAGVCMASKRRGGLAPYVALLVAVVIFVPAVREVAVDLLRPLVGLLKDVNPFGG